MISKHKSCVFEVRSDETMRCDENAHQKINVYIRLPVNDGNPSLHKRYQENTVERKEQGKRYLYANLSQKHF